ncbi:MAG: hypothetical protein KBS80_06225 [Bacteroidales bacterium]|nr:hypothetical protein [Candidatus Cryptobacteroides choladohippi]
MKKHFIMWGLVIPALALTFACTQKELDGPNNFSLKDGVYAIVDNPVEIDAPATKALSPDMKFYFTGSERLDVFSETAGEKMTYKIKSVSEDPKTCTFQVNSFGLLDATYSALLPAQGLYDDASAVPVSLLGQVQKGNASTEHLAAFDYNTAIADIKNNAGVFEFKHLVSWIRCNVNFIEACTVKSVTLTADGTPFVVKADINVPQKAISPKENASSITLSYENGIEVAAGEKLTSYFTIFNADLVNLNVVVDAECNGESVSYTMKAKDLPAASVAAGSVFTREVTAVPDGVVAMIGKAPYKTLAEAVTAAEAGNTVEILVADTYKIPNLPKNITIKGDVAGVVFDCVGTGSIASVPNGATFENATFNFGQSSYHGFQHAGTININGCTLNGLLYSYGDMNFKGCTFNQDSKEYMMWAYGNDITYTDCVFNGKGKFINVYCEKNTVVYNVTATGCTFNSDTKSKAAFNVKETCINNGNMLNYNVVISNCTANENFPAATEFDKTNTLWVIDPLVQVDDRNLSAPESGITVTLDGNKVYPVAKPAVAKIGDIEYETLADAVTAAAAGDTVEILVADTYKIPNLPKNITIKGDVAGVVFDCEGTGSIASVPNGATFENATFNFGQSSYHGFQHAGTINMNGCTMNGLLFSYGDMNFDGCIFNQDKAEYMMWAYGKDLAYTDCVFNGMGKFINVYCESNSDVYNVIAEGCEFNSTTTSKSAFNVKETCGTTMLKYNVEISNCTANENFPEAKEDGRLLVIDPLVQVDDRNLSDTESGITVTLDGKKVYPVAKADLTINSVEELLAFAEAVNGGNTMAGKLVQLAADIDLQGVDWKPIGNVTSYPGVTFAGTFDGCNHTISNMNTSDYLPNHATAGFFGSIMGTVKNLTLESVAITSTHYAGAIAGYTSANNDCVIENCHVIGGAITSTTELVDGSYDNGDKVGGIIGYIVGGVTVKGCSVNGVTITAYRDLGGIVGSADNATALVTDNTVENSVIIQDNTNGYKTSVSTYGAIIGRTGGAAIDSSNTATNVEVKSVN